LNCHPEIAAPFEIPIARYHFGQPNENLMIDKTLQIAGLVDACAKTSIEDSKYLFSKIRAYEQKKTLVVKEPSNSNHVMRIRTDFGPVPMIHIVRDVRQMMASKAFEASKIAYTQAARLWYDSNLNIIKYRHYFPDYFFLRYEDLTANPEGEIRRLLHFMGKEYVPGMLEYWNYEHSDEKLSLWDGKTPDSSPWAEGLGTRNIEPREAALKPEIMDFYQKSSGLLWLNGQFGYSNG
jgi:hypothetical protein